MASQANKKRKGKGVAYDSDRFISAAHENRYKQWFINKAIISEVGFDLPEDACPEIQDEIRRRHWEHFCSPQKMAMMRIVHHFYANAWIPATEWTERKDKFQSFVGGKFIDFSPEAINRTLRIQRTTSNCIYKARIEGVRNLSSVVRDLCKEGAMWKCDSQGNENQLRKADFLPVAKGWLAFVQHSLLPTSNLSEVNVERAVLVHCLVSQFNIDVGSIIAADIQARAQSQNQHGKLGFPCLITQLCLEAGAAIDEDIPLPLERPITMAIIEGVRRRTPTAAPAQQPQAEQEEPSDPQRAQQHTPQASNFDDLRQEVRALRAFVRRHATRTERKMDYIINALQALAPGGVPPPDADLFTPLETDNEIAADVCEATDEEED